MKKSQRFEMSLNEAIQVLHEVHGQQYSWLKAWGLSTIRSAIRIVLNRKSASKEDIELAYGIKEKLSRKW